MSKNEADFKFRVGYNNYETKDEAVKEASRRALRDWNNETVWEKVGEAKCDLSKLSPDLVSYADVQ